MKERVLIIGLVWPEPTSSAAGSRMMQLISVFTDQGWDVTFASAAAKSEHTADLESYGIKLQNIFLNHSSFDDLVLALQPTIVVFDRFMIEEQYGWRIAEHCPDAIRILDSEDLHFLRKARRKAVLAGSPINSADLFTDDTRREIASILRCDLSLIISSFEMKLLSEQFNINTELVHYVPFLSRIIDSTITESWKSYEARTGFMFIGNFHHEPNRDAVTYLKKSIWPLIRKSLPEATVMIYGAYMPESIVQLHKEEDGFFICGRAYDAHEVIGSARVMLAPLRYGAGLKGKLLEAMVAGTPAITTSMGAEGMSDDQGWNGFIADDTTIFAQRAVEVYQDQKAWQQSVLSGVGLHNRQFLKDDLIPEFLGKLSEVRINLSAHRRSNFIGSILHYSANNASRYMSKWIEAKNSRGV